MKDEMRFSYTLFIALILVCFVYSCTGNKKHPPISEEKTGMSETITLKNADLHQVLDSFSKLNLQYYRCIPTIGYLKIIESKGNDEMKLLIQSFEINSPDLKKLSFNKEFKVNDYRFYLDENNDNFFEEQDSRKNLGQTVKKESHENAGKKGCGSQYTWLVHFSGKSIDTISYRATSQFVFPCWRCDEWGDLSRTFVKTKGSDSLKRIEF